jgi:hypothetical protein
MDRRMRAEGNFLVQGSGKGLFRRLGRLGDRGEQLLEVGPASQRLERQRRIGTRSRRGIFPGSLSCRRVPKPQKGGEHKGKYQDNRITSPPANFCVNLPG